MDGWSVEPYVFDSTPPLDVLLQPPHEFPSDQSGEIDKDALARHVGEPRQVQLMRDGDRSL
jgi:hypothetical protein